MTEVVMLEAPQERARILENKLAGFADIGDRLAEIGRLVPGRLAFSTSLGLEDQVLLHAIDKADVDVDVFMLDTGRHFPETFDVLDASQKAFSVPIRIVVPQADEVERLVARDGIYGFRLSLEARKSCCDIRKVRPLKRALQGAGGWITGMRRGQSSGRADVPLVQWDDDQGLIKINPIADWPLDRLERYVEDNNVPVSALHSRGFPSIGCQPCTRAVKPGEDIRAGRWWWENEDGKECGLHNRPQKRTA